MSEHPFRTEKFSQLPEESVTELYRNKKLELPFDPKSLAVFLDREHGTIDLRVLPYHHRSADPGTSTLIKEKSGERVYCQFDLKGIGFLFPESFESKKDDIPLGTLTGYPEAHIAPGSSEDPWGYRSLGLMDERMAKTVIKTSDLLTEKGMRVEGIAAVFRLAQINIDGKLMPIQEFKKGVTTDWRQQAKRMGSAKRTEYREMARDVEKRFDPVLIIRVMRSVFRLRDLRDADDAEEADLMIEEACSNLNTEMQELGRPERFDASTREGRAEWLKFISSWYATNAGLLHAEGLSHLFFHMGNLSLAGEMVDLDTVNAFMEKKTFRSDEEKRQGWLNKYRRDPLFRETPDGCIVSNIPNLRQPDSRFGLPKPLIKDMRDLCFSMRLILKGPLHSFGGGKPYAEEMTRCYERAIGSGETLNEWGIDPKRVKEAFAQIAEEVVGRGAYYAPIDFDKES